MLCRALSRQTQNHLCQCPCSGLQKTHLFGCSLLHSLDFCSAFAVTNSSILDSRLLDLGSNQISIIHAYRRDTNAAAGQVYQSQRTDVHGRCWTWKTSTEDNATLLNRYRTMSRFQQRSLAPPPRIRPVEDIASPYT